MSIQPNSNTGSFFTNLRTALGPGWRKLPLLLCLMLFATALDLLGVALIAPFLATMIGSENIPLAAGLGQLVPVDVSTLGMLLLAAFVAKGIAAYAVQAQIARVTEGERARLMVRLLGSFQARSWQWHLGRNSSELVNVVTWFTQAFTSGVLANGLRVISDLLVMLALVLFLAMTDLRAVVMLAALLAVVFAGVTWFMRKRLSSVLAGAARNTAEVMNAVQQALGALREVRLLGREAYFRRRLARAAGGLVDAAAGQAALTLVPRQTIEVVMVGFLVLLVWVTQFDSGNTLALVPILGTFAAAALRLMPASTSLLSCWNNVLANRFALHTIAEELGAAQAARAADEQSINVAPEVFREIALSDVVFRYEGSNSAAIDQVSMRIVAGEVVGLMGRSGAGKSTLADLLLGLLSPDAGTVRVNGWEMTAERERWQRMAAYIPQSVYLLDDSLRRNIALGVDDLQIDESRVASAVDSAQLGELVQSLADGLDTVVGERGVRLSGGQRQRVALARALYHQRQFLVLDEATSALDAETEAAIVDSISALTGRVTMLIIAHRMATLAPCGRILNLSAGRISEHAET